MTYSLCNFVTLLKSSLLHAAYCCMEEYSVTFQIPHQRRPIALLIRLLLFLFYPR